jgi:hypothetical protein
MREQEVQRYQWEFEGYVESWKSFGIDLVDAGSPNPCSRSANARKVLHGRWQEAYEEWLREGEFSRPLEEMYLGFILASKKIIKGGPSAKVPMPLPKRIWSDKEYTKSLRHFQDLEYRDKMLGHLLEPGKTSWGLERVAIGTLIMENKPEEAERLFYQYEWQENDLAETHLALIRTCASAQLEAENVKALWFYAPPGGQRRGPAGFAQMIDAFRQGKLMRTCLVWREGMPAWQPAAEVKCFAAVAYAGALPPPLPRS